MNNLAESFLEAIGTYDTQMIVAAIALLLLAGLIFEDETGK